MSGIQREIKCARCGHEFFVDIKSWYVSCPKCRQEMVRKGANDYCICTHTQSQHIGNLGNLEFGCSDCNCLNFNSVKEQNLEEYDKEILEGKGCSHFFKRIKTEEANDIQYKCDKCGCTTNFKPNYWQSVDDRKMDENDKKQE